MLEKKSYLTSRLICGLGNSMFMLVFTWWLQVQTKSSSIVGIANAIFSITGALSIFYGPFIDSHSYKKTSIYSMVCQVVLNFLLTIIVVFFTQNFALAIIVSGLLSVCDEFFAPADRAILKETISEGHEMTAILSQVNIIDQFVNLGGTALSGALLAFMVSGQILLACSCLSLMGFLLLLIALKNVPSQNMYQSKPHETCNFMAYLKQVISGYSYMKKNSFLIHYFWSSILYSFATPSLMLILPKIAQEENNASLYSVFYILFFVGAIVGALLAGKMKVKLSTITLAWILNAVPIGLFFFFQSNLIIFCLLILLIGPAASIHNILADSKIQSTTTDNYLGRVLTTIRTGTQIGGPISSVIGGILLDYTGIKPIVLTCSILILLGGINLLFIKER